HEQGRDEDHVRNGAAHRPQRHGKARDRRLARPQARGRNHGEGKNDQTGGRPGKSATHKTVPVEPTDKMIDAVIDRIEDDEGAHIFIKNLYEDMLAAAPASPPISDAMRDAAPELYAACKAIVAYQESEAEWSVLEGMGVYDKAVAAARYAIAKAE